MRLSIMDGCGSVYGRRDFLVVVNESLISAVYFQNVVNSGGTFFSLVVYFHVLFRVFSS